MREFLDLLVVASNPVVKVLLITAIGLFLAFDRVDVLGENARVHLNKIVFYVFCPALVGGNLAKTVTWESFLTLWFMPVNILITFIIGSVLGWLLAKVTRAPKHIKGLIIGACSAGNLGNLIIILVPAMCNEKGSPFGDAELCQEFSLAYSSLSMAIGAVYMWTYVYNIVRISAKDNEEGNQDQIVDNKQPLLSSTVYSLEASEDQLTNSSSMPVITLSDRIIQLLTTFTEKINLKALFAPSTIAAIIGFSIGIISPLRKLVIGHEAPLHVVGDSAYMLGNAAIPALTLIIGANLFKGLKGPGIKLRIVMGILFVRYIILPLLGIVIIKGVTHIGLVPFDNKLFVFILLIQYAVPPAMNISTMTQLFGAGQSECSVIMLWTYALASVSLTFWSTLFLWLVS